MGRKNKRTNSEDKKFDNFIKNFMSEQKDKQQRHSFKKSTIESRKEIYENRRNKERMDFAIEQLELNNIEYEIVDESRGLIHCKRKSDNHVFRFYVNTGFIVGFSDFKGLRSLIILLNENTEVSNG